MRTVVLEPEDLVDGGEVLEDAAVPAMNGA